MNKHIESASCHNQRLGQFISNAITEYLIDTNRVISDEEIANAFFYLSDEDFNDLLNRYTDIMDARKGIKYGKNADA